MSLLTQGLNYRSACDIIQAHSARFNPCVVLLFLHTLALMGGKKALRHLITENDKPRRINHGELKDSIPSDFDVNRQLEMLMLPLKSEILVSPYI